MRDEAARPQSEMDVLKFYIWLMVVMTLALAGVLWKTSSDLESTKKNLAQGKTWLTDFAAQQAEIQGMLNVYHSNKEDIARDAPMTWFSAAWNARGINGNSMQPGAWKVPPRFDNRGKYSEESIEMSVNPKAALPRQSIAEFCHEIEKRSTRLRILELDVHRTDKENFDKDEWAGKIIIAYRHTPQQAD